MYVSCLFGENINGPVRRKNKWLPHENSQICWHSKLVHYLLNFQCGTVRSLLRFQYPMANLLLVLLLSTLEPGYCSRYCDRTAHESFLNFQQRQEILLFSEMSTPPLVVILPSIQRIRSALFWWPKPSNREAVCLRKTAGGFKTA